MKTISKSSWRYKLVQWTYEHRNNIDWMPENTLEFNLHLILAIIVYIPTLIGMFGAISIGFSKEERLCYSKYGKIFACNIVLLIDIMVGIMTIVWIYNMFAYFSCDIKIPNFVIYLTPFVGLLSLYFIHLIHVLYKRIKDYLSEPISYK